ncbi:hypothetical protein Tco_1090891 [Tanacetum coccineum]|uniref:Reverse transcriptase domain-containing protein n=1 Tax=Tanacetum coccineum TaxID=301880 RepID=A0ABQ5I5I1_9ASTR
MSNNEQTPLSQPTSAVRNTLRKEQVLQNLAGPISDEALREYCDKNYHQILPIIAEKVHQEKVQQEKLRAVKARLNFDVASRHSISGTPNRGRNLKERLGPRYTQNKSRSPEKGNVRPRSPREGDSGRKIVFKRLEKDVFHRLGGKGRSESVHSKCSKQESEYESHRKTESYYQISRPKETDASHEERHRKKKARKEQKSCQKAKEVWGDTRSRSQKYKSQAWKTTCLDHGCVRRLILSLLRSVTSTSREPECLVIYKLMTKVKIRRII